MVAGEVDKSSRKAKQGKHNMFCSTADLRVLINLALSRVELLLRDAAPYTA